MPFEPYSDAKVHLLTRLGRYCSYCERRIETGLAVEHIQPKALVAYKAIEGEWTNFLLGCVNCNSTKGKKDVVLSDVLLPDRDNTFLAFHYSLDGAMRVADGLSIEVSAKAVMLLEITGLDRRVSTVIDDNGKQIVVDRASKRMEVYAIALEAVADYENDPDNLMLQKWIVISAIAEGQFSIWMSAFAGKPIILKNLIDAHRGTRESGCFDSLSQIPITPHPNLDGLISGSKI